MFNQLLRAVGIKSVKAQFSFAFAIIILLSFVASGWTLSTLDSSANTVDIAGKQRMLTQRLAKEALLITQGIVKRDLFFETVNEFEKAHKQLLTGDQSAGIHPPRAKHVTEKLNDIYVKWSTYKNTLSSYINKPDTALLPVFQAQSSDLFADMNRIVGLMAVLDEQRHTHRVIVIFIVSILTLVTALISRFLGLSWLMRQLDILKSNIIKVGDGDFSCKLVGNSSDNEIGQIFDAYNRMQSQVRDMVSEVTTLSSNLNSMVVNLRESSDQSSHKMHEQTLQIEQVAAAINEISCTAKEIAEHAKVADENADDVSSQAQQGDKVVRISVEGMDKMASKLGDAVEVMQQLDDDSTEIGKVLTVITGIAEQTNLLALNAAIEAARAGDQGRGFAVVADEVRTLAKRTQESTEEIQSIISRLQNQSSRAVDVMRDSSESAHSGTQNIKEACSVLEAISASIHGIQKTGQFISDASREQSVVVESIDDNIGNISVASQETNQVAQSVHESSKQIEILVDDLNSTLKKFRV